MYLAESGLIGGPFPNHKTVFTAQPGRVRWTTAMKCSWCWWPTRVA
jgi:hypothetical protein